MAVAGVNAVGCWRLWRKRDGSAEYRLKNEHGSLVSKQKIDLEMMLDHLNIQTENPCAILDQENAKLFLKGNPGDKYKFFLQSTDLYKMRTTYSKIDEDTRNISDSVLKREKVKIVTLSKAMKEAEERWEEAQSVRPTLLRCTVKLDDMLTG